MSHKHIYKTDNLNPFSLKGFVFSIIFGFCISILPILTNAKSKQDNLTITPSHTSVTIDVNNKNSYLNNNELNTFIEAQNVLKVKFIAKVEDELFFSKKPIVIQVHPIYRPSNLTDLGLKISASNLIFNKTIVKVSHYVLVTKSIYMLPIIGFNCISG